MTDSSSKPDPSREFLRKLPGLDQALTTVTGTLVPHFVVVYRTFTDEGLEPDVALALTQTYMESVMAKARGDVG
jgi:hypothetical protein